MLGIDDYEVEEEQEDDYGVADRFILNSPISDEIAPAKPSTPRSDEIKPFAKIVRKKFPESWIFDNYTLG